MAKRISTSMSIRIRRVSVVLALAIGAIGVGSCDSDDDEGGCPLTDCGGSCVDTRFDPAHCGGCGNVCPTNQLCSSGSCADSCGGGTTECGGLCVDTNLDPANCGTCSNSCAAGELCSGGTCGLECVGGTTECGSVCVDTNIDPSHCGGCDAPCDPGEVCTAGSCGLPALSFGSIAPDHGYYPGGLTVTILGTVFDHTTEVSIDGEPCPIIEWISGSELTCLTPTGTPGAADVILTNGASETATGADAFTYADFTTVTTIVGTGTAGITNGAGDVAQVSGAVNGLTADGATVYVADGTNYAIRTLDLSQLDASNIQASDVTVATLAGGTMGTQDSTDSTGATAQFRQPDDPGVPIFGLLHMSDTEWAGFSVPTALRTVDVTTGETTTFINASTYYGYAGLAWDGGPFLYAAECSNINTIRRIDLTTNGIIDFAGTAGVFGDVDDTGPAAEMNCPYGLDIDATGENLYFVDWDNAKLRSIDIGTKAVATVAGTGVAGFADATQGSQAQFDSPGKVAVAGNYAFVADLNNCAVRQVNLTTTEVTTLAGSPSNCVAAVVDGPLASATFASPGGIAYHPVYGLVVSSTDWGWRTEPVSHKIRLIH